MMPKCKKGLAVPRLAPSLLLVNLINPIYLLLNFWSSSFMK
jgi:hypothetical protein